VTEGSFLPSVGKVKTMEETTTTTTTEGQPFMVTDRQSAEWALRKIAAKQAEIALVQAQAADMLRSLQSDLDSFTGRYQPQLENWARTALEATGGKSRTVKTLCGNLSFRTVPPRLVVESEADALQTAKLVCPQAVVVVPATEKLDKATLTAYAKERLETEGELLPGFTLTEERQSFAIKFASAGKGTGETQESD
jgi:hypothetical protein